MEFHCYHIFPQICSLFFYLKEHLTITTREMSRPICLSWLKERNIKIFWLYPLLPWDLLEFRKMLTNCSTLILLAPHGGKGITPLSADAQDQATLSIALSEKVPSEAGHYPD